MKRITSSKFFAATAVVLGTFVAASAAHARSDVYFSIGVPAPVYVEPAPVYVQPRPVYVQPQPVYVQPRPVYVQPQPVYTPAPVYYGQGYGHRYYGERRHGHRYGPYGDFDRDGIRNQDDRDRDGDGVRNRHDRQPNNPYRY
ncbi:hypothetical protein [Caenimonas soli]|uniref:hypothetical protein n=1 Tax=Caenimonas soli TaxID=2735555 RepID=UPI001553FB24|nr:hypothetical protein [Caenimonas soli]NPC58697.1 hypothetical protein [Caenimonas soli]